MDILKNQISKLSNEGLVLVLEDANHRIGSHAGMSEEPNQNYIAKQKEIIGYVKDEMERRVSIKN